MMTSVILVYLAPLVAGDVFVFGCLYYSVFRHTSAVHMCDIASGDVSVCLSVRLSICLSVCLSHTGIDLKLITAESCLWTQISHSRSKGEPVVMASNATGVCKEGDTDFPPINHYISEMINVMYSYNGSLIRNDVSAFSCYQF